MKKIIVLLVITLLSCDIQLTYPEADLTIMFYIGDDSGKTITLINDFLELTEKQVNSKNIRVTILYDGPKPGDSSLFVLDTPLGITYREVPLDNTGIPNTQNEIDMHDPDVLRTYINYVKTKLPAKKYALYFGSHGTGFSNGWDSGLQLEEDNVISVKTISEIINETGSVDLLAFDACLMGNIDNIFELEDATDYLVASPELIPGDGNSYADLISSIFNYNGVLGIKDLGELTLKSYYNYYDLNETFVSENNEDPKIVYDKILLNKDILQLYDINGIIGLIRNDKTKFEASLRSFNDVSRSVKFNYNEYTELYSYLINDYPTLSNYVTSSGEHTWLSINHSYYSNNDYENTKFAREFPFWVDLIKSSLGN